MTYVEIRFLWLSLSKIKMKWSPLYPHLWVKEAFPFLWFFWFAWMDFGGRNSGNGFNIDSPLSSFRIWLRIRINLWLESLQLSHEGLLGATFFGVVPRTVMVLTPFSHVLLHILISLLLLQPRLVVLIVAIYALSLTVCFGDSFSLLRLWGVFWSKLLPLLLKFPLDINNISISCTQWCDV